MLTLDIAGAETLLGFLQRRRQGHTPDAAEMAQVLEANAYFIDFYSQWEGCTRDDLAAALRNFADPDAVPPGPLPQRLADGFRQAVDELPQIAARLAWLREVDTAQIVARVAAWLPPATPLDAVIHITVDNANNAFMYRGDMGTSVLRMSDRATFADAVAHELHHAGVRFWHDRDPVRQALAAEHSGRTVAMLHVANLLSEGLANFYLTPRYVFRTTDTPPEDSFQARLAQLEREEGACFAEAASVLARALAPGATYADAFTALQTLAMDLEHYMLPAGHYLGARMVQTMDAVHPRDRIIACVRDLPAFLPLYNDAAHRAGAFVFDDAQVAAFAHLWEAPPA